MVTVLIFKLFSNFLLVWHSLRYRTPIPPWTYYISMQVEQVLCLVASICAPRAPLHPSTLYLGSPTCALHQFEPHMPSSYLGVPLMAALEKKKYQREEARVIRSLCPCFLPCEVILSWLCPKGTLLLSGLPTSQEFLSFQLLLTSPSLCASKQPLD